MFWEFAFLLGIAKLHFSIDFVCLEVVTAQSALSDIRGGVKFSSVKTLTIRVGGPLDVEDCFKVLLRQQYYVMKNKLGHPN